MESVSEFKDCGEGWAVSTAFQKANVLRMIAALKREGFLGQVAFCSELKKGSRKRPFFPRARFVSSRHPQHGVCFESADSSTNYTIPNANIGEISLYLPDTQGQPAPALSTPES